MRPVPRTRTPDLDTICATAAECFAEHGYNNVTMQELADRLRIAKPTLYAHAGSKPQILERIFDLVASSMDREVARAEALPTHRERLDGVVAVLPSILEKPNHLEVFLRDGRELPHELAARHRRWSAGMVRRIRTIVEEGQAAGELDATHSPTVIAFGVVAVTMWSPRWIGDPDVPSVAEVTSMHRQIFERALAPAPGRKRGGQFRAAQLKPRTKRSA